MKEALGFVVIAVVGIVLVAGIIATISSRGSAYDQIGRGGLSLGEASSGSQAPSFAGARAEQEEEIRQMLRARNERRVRRGQAPLDVEAETARLLGRVGANLPASFEDQALVEEVRQLVEARNARRIKQGRAPLDVEAEVERRLRELGA
jgi:hypothetical protein